MSAAAHGPTGVVLGCAAALSLLLAACTMTDENGEYSASVGSPAIVDNVVLASQVQSQLAKKNGGTTPPINCPDQLKATVGEKTTCTMTGPSGTFDVEVMVTRVEWGDVVLDDGTPGNFAGGNAQFDAKVADKPNR